MQFLIDEQKKIYKKHQCKRIFFLLFYTLDATRL